MRKNSNLSALVLVALTLGLVGCGGSGSDGQPTMGPMQLVGINFSPFTDGSDPSQGAQVTESEIYAKVATIAPYTGAIRTFATNNGLEYAGAAAHQNGLTAVITAWIGVDPVANDQQLANLISMANAGDVDVAVIGSEVLLRGDLSASELIDLINSVRGQLPSDVPIATADVYQTFIDNPSLVAAIDQLYVNYYPYWEGVAVENAMAEIHQRHEQVKSISQGKPVVVSETGWPSAGLSVGAAVPNLANAAFYFHNFVSWATIEDVPFFYFEGFDEPWKAAYEGPQGAHWGILDVNGDLKPGMEIALSGSLAPDTWSPAGPSPSIIFTFVPPVGSMLDLKGKVLHASPSDYLVLVYIRVGGLWWTKPLAAQPFTEISNSGFFVTDVTTGGNDPAATEIAAFLVPIGTSAPIALGTSDLPFAAFDNAVASLVLAR